MFTTCQCFSLLPLDGAGAGVRAGPGQAGRGGPGLETQAGQAAGKPVYLPPYNNELAIFMTNSSIYLSDFFYKFKQEGFVTVARITGKT